ncbi:uncharacterized protein LOC114523862 [Dendronephthya gigantea]|uniref:uncharacterized protein LOC114523862 n=1 Tax=Dendronephthya gigantea TaxID=151771 RepID=UPI001069F1E3|nr:uncharacterized protein LOC114523862 [Dendronephthya gigantea]
MALKSMVSSLLFFSVIMMTVASPRRRYPTPQELKQYCPAVFDKPCTGNNDCQCNYPVRLICNYKNVCNRISMMDILMRIRCPKVFKKSCSFDDDCNSSCPGMICEDNECVDKKRITT